MVLPRERLAFRGDALSVSDVGRGGSGPLAGLTVAVTRPATKEGRLAADLAGLGADVIEAPLLRLVPPRDPKPLLGVATRLDEFDWVVLTSSAGVRALSQAVARAGGSAPDRLAVVGKRTAAVASAVGWRPDLVPARFDAEGLLKAFDDASVPLNGVRVLLALAEGAREIVREGLRARGATVEQVAAYGSVATAPGDLTELAAGLRDRRIDLLTFTSSSAARNLLAALGPSVLAVPTAAVGSVTAGTARELGYMVVVVAEEHTMDGLVRAVSSWWEGR